MSKSSSLKRAVLILAAVLVGVGASLFSVFLAVLVFEYPYTTPLIAIFFLLCAQWRSRASRLSRPRTWGLRRFADFCFSNKTYIEILEPIFSDMEKEHFAALAASRPWKARMALVRGYWSFWSAVVAQLPISLARRVYEIWKTSKTGS